VVKERLILSSCSGAGNEFFAALFNEKKLVAKACAIGSK
jgi:hypothetical protein